MVDDAQVDAATWDTLLRWVDVGNHLVVAGLTPPPAYPLALSSVAEGHALVVPIEEVDHWLDLDPDLNAHLVRVAQRIGQAQQAAFSPVRVGLVVAGLEVPHVHLHVIARRRDDGLRLHADWTRPERADLDAVAERVRAALAL